MSYETQLKENYAQTHQRLMNGKPKLVVVPPPAVIPEVIPEIPTVKIDRPRPPIRLKILLQSIAIYENIPIVLLASDRRQKHVTDARQLFYFLAHHYTTATLLQIGDTVGGRDHTTVLHGIRVIERLCAESELWKNRVNQYALLIEDGDNGEKLNLSLCPHCGQRLKRRR